MAAWGADTEAKLRSFVHFAIGVCAPGCCSHRIATSCVRSLVCSATRPLPPRSQLRCSRLLAVQESRDAARHTYCRRRGEPSSDCCSRRIAIADEHGATHRSKLASHGPGSCIAVPPPPQQRPHDKTSRKAYLVSAQNGRSPVGVSRFSGKRSPGVGKPVLVCPRRRFCVSLSVRQCARWAARGVCAVLA